MEMRKYPKVIYFLITILFVAFLVGCGSDDTDTTDTDEPAATEAAPEEEEAAPEEEEAAPEEEAT
jgi:hypothetical protein